MAKKVISLEFSYSRETKNYHVYILVGEHEFFPKQIHISKEDMKEAAQKITMTIEEV